MVSIAKAPSITMTGSTESSRTVCHGDSMFCLSYLHSSPSSRIRTRYRFDRDPEVRRDEITAENMKIAEGANIANEYSKLVEERDAIEKSSNLVRRVRQEYARLPELSEAKEMFLTSVTTNDSEVPESELARTSTLADQVSQVFGDVAAAVHEAFLYNPRGWMDDIPGWADDVGGEATKAVEETSTPAVLSTWKFKKRTKDDITALPTMLETIHTSLNSVWVDKDDFWNGHGAQIWRRRLPDFHMKLDAISQAYHGVAQELKQAESGAASTLAPTAED